MKKVFLILFIIAQLFNVTTPKVTAKMIHTHAHTHTNIEGTEHIYEHKHAENLLTLYCRIATHKTYDFLPRLEYSNPLSITAKPLLDGLFRPPIA